MKYPGGGAMEDCRGNLFIIVENVFNLWLNFWTNQHKEYEQLQFTAPFEEEWTYAPQSGAINY